MSALSIISSDARAQIAGDSFGQSSGPIVLNNVVCRGSEQTLFQCQRDNLDVGSCTRSQDAGVECIEGKGSAHYYSTTVVGIGVRLGEAIPQILF